MATSGVMEWPHISDIVLLRGVHVGKRSRIRYVWGAAVSIFLGIALAVPSGGLAKAATPSAALNGGVAAFEGSNTSLYLCDIPPGGCTNTTLGMKAGASPAVYSEDNGLVWAAFEANTGKLYVTERSAAGAVKNLNTGLDIANLTTPSITVDSVNANNSNYPIVKVAFHGINGNLDIYNYNTFPGAGGWWVNTGLSMYPGTSPSIVESTNGFSAFSELTVAFANSANHLGLYFALDGGPASSITTTLGMYAGSSPSITWLLSGPAGAPTVVYSVAFDDNQGKLYLAYFNDTITSQSGMKLENIGLPIYPGTNPSLPRPGPFGGTRANEVSVYMAITGYLCAWNDATAQQNCGFNQLVKGSPAVALVQGDYWAAFESPVSNNFRGFNTATGGYFEQPMYNNTNAALSS
jgi:hypothetical protein